jgi:N-ethylmaleimide reductase
MVCNEQRASTGLIITEGAQVSLDAVGYISILLVTDEQVEGWKKSNQACMIKAEKSLFNCGM